MLVDSSFTKYLLIIKNSHTKKFHHKTVFVYLFIYFIGVTFECEIFGGRLDF